MATSRSNPQAVPHHPAPATRPVFFRAAPDRRNLPRRQALLARVQSEVVEMPGLALTLPMATRLFGLPPEVCERLLDVLVSDGALRRTSDGRYSLQLDS